MTLKGSKTEQSLRSLFSAELEARARYQFFAEAAEKAGVGHVADMFLAIATNETEHASQVFKFMGGTEDVRKNLKQVIEQETKDFQARYSEAAEAAAEEGFDDIALFFRKARDDERRHQQQFGEVLRGLERGELPQGRTVQHSSLTMAHLVMPHHANPAGFAHGGELMKFMDNAATVVAVRHCHSSVVTAMVDELRFLSPVRVGNVVFLSARVTFVSSASMEIRVEVEVEDLEQEAKTPAVTAYFVMVAVNEAGKPSKVPPLILCTEREEQLFHEAGLRFRARKARSIILEND